MAAKLAKKMDLDDISANSKSVAKERYLLQAVKYFLNDLQRSHPFNHLIGMHCSFSHFLCLSVVKVFIARLCV